MCHFCPRCHCAIFVFVKNVPYLFSYHLCHFHLCHFHLCYFNLCYVCLCLFHLCHFFLNRQQRTQCCFQYYLRIGKRNACVCRSRDKMKLMDAYTIESKLFDHIFSFLSVSISSPTPTCVSSKNEA